MHKIQFSEESQVYLPKESSKTKHKMKSPLQKIKDYQFINLNQSQMKHMHAIRPYRSKQRKSSRIESRCNQSPYEMSRSKSKKLEINNKKSEDRGKPSKGKQMNEMYGQLISLKSQYKMLKNNYNKLLDQKNEMTQKQKQQNSCLKQQLENNSKELDRCCKQLERSKKNGVLLQQQIDRIKRQCYKLIEMQKFKIKKLEQTLQEKDLMIAYLRNELDNVKRGNENIPGQSLYFLQNSTPLFNFDYLTKPTNISALSNIHNNQDQKQRNDLHIEEDSLSFSRDKSKQMDSIINSFLSNHDQSIQPLNFIKKDNILINSLQESPIQSEESQQVSQKRQESQNCKLVKALQNSKQTISVIHKKSKLNTKRLQLQIADENVDNFNVNKDASNDNQEISNDTRKKLSSSGLGIKQRKKTTVKKNKLH